MAEIQQSLVLLTNAVTSIAPQQPPNGDSAPMQPQSRREDESISISESGTPSVAPIQVIRNMNYYWITGRRPDGKTEIAGRDDASTISFEAPPEGNYIPA